VHLNIIFHWHLTAHTYGDNKIKTIYQKVIPIASFILLFIGLFPTVCLADEVTIIGEVNDNYQIVANGQIYEVADNAIGSDLIKNYISQTVRVTGTIEETDDAKIITVATFKVVTE
jgi:hypothetical protein